MAFMISLVYLLVNLLIVMEFVYIFYLETIRTTSSLTAKTFGLDRVALMNNANLQNALKNQGIYNLGIAILLFLATFIFRTAWVVNALQLYIIAVAIYGAFTVRFNILWKQGGLAMIALVIDLMNGFN